MYNEEQVKDLMSLAYLEGMYAGIGNAHSNITAFLDDNFMIDTGNMDTPESMELSITEIIEKEKNAKAKM